VDLNHAVEPESQRETRRIEEGFAGGPTSDDPPVMNPIEQPLEPGAGPPEEDAAQAHDPMVEK
jgi:hypothetical protein